MYDSVDWKSTSIISRYSEESELGRRLLMDVKMKFFIDMVICCCGQLSRYTISYSRNMQFPVWLHICHHYNHHKNYSQIVYFCMREGLENYFFCLHSRFKSDIPQFWGMRFWFQTSFLKLNNLFLNSGWVNSIFKSSVSM